MITSAKNYTKKKKKTDRKNPGTNGKSKCIQAESQRRIHIHTHKKEKNEKIYIYINKRKRATNSVKKSTSDNKI